MMHCKMCSWNDGFSGNSRVCGLALHGGETVHIKKFLVKDELCPLHIAPNTPLNGDHGHGAACKTCGNITKTAFCPLCGQAVAH